MELNDEKIYDVGQLFKTVSDPTRIRIMLCLLDDSKCSCGCQCNGMCVRCNCLSCMIEKKVSDIMLEINASQSLVSHQLKTLKDGNLVKSRKEGTTVYYSLKDGYVKEMLSLAIEHVKGEN